MNGLIKVRHPDAHIARIFPIVGIKNSESLNESDWKYKGRVVLGGNNIQGTDDSVAVFTDLAATPANMIATRSLLAVSCRGQRSASARLRAGIH